MSFLGDYIKTLRGKRSQEEIGKLAGITGAALSRIESGEREDFKISTLLGLARALRVHPMKLIYAYEGKDPDTVREESANDDILDALEEILQKRRGNP